MKERFCPSIPYKACEIDLFSVDDDHGTIQPQS